MEENKNQNTKNTENKSEDNKQPEFFSDNNNNNNNHRWYQSSWIYILLGLIFISIQFVDFGKGSQEITWTDLSKKISNKEVSKIIIVNKEKAEIYLVNSENANRGTFSNPSPDYYMTIGSIESFETKVDNAQNNIPLEEHLIISYEKREDIIGNVISWILPIVLLVVVWMFIFRKMSGGGAGGSGHIFNIGKSKAKMFDNEENNIKINFNDVAGLDEAKVEIREIVDFLKNPGKYTELGGKIPKGALLVGPPGTGKTLLAKAVAGEAHVPFFSMSGSDFVEMFVGVGASRVRDLFRQAKEKAPCIIFIDEIDAIGRARGKNPNMGSNDERENTLNQLLTEMDGFDTNKGVIILAATNRADILDKALMRAGRFDRQIYVELPDINGREDIFKVHLKPLKNGDDVDAAYLAKQTPGFSGADIANVCNEAALIAARKEKKMVEKQDFLDAIDRIVGGLEKKNKIITATEKRTIAFHEAGHATLSWLLEYANPLIKVTIIPRGKALGAAWYLPEERQITTKEQIIDEMCATLGGRIAEELIMGKISTGALNDLEKVTKQAYAMVKYYGMSEKIGNICFYDSTGENEYSFNKPYSETTDLLIDQEAKAIIDEAYQKARKILSENIDGLTKLANLLLEREVIFSEDVERIFGKKQNSSKETTDEKSTSQEINTDTTENQNSNE